MGWFYRQNGQEKGPVSAVEVKELVETGKMRLNQSLWRRDGEALMYVRAEALVKGLTNAK